MDCNKENIMNYSNYKRSIDFFTNQIESAASKYYALEWLDINSDLSSKLLINNNVLVYFYIFYTSIRVGLIIDINR